MPQGGIDRGEEPAEAALRELGEETGLNARLVEPLGEVEPWLYYDFPPQLKARLAGPYIGQRQKWFAFRFLGTDSDVRLDEHSPEFDAWRWAKLSEAPDLVIPFKRPVYEEVARRFAPFAEG
jgi:putative (di)nucleoside polyphosphate hydrolase